MTRACHTAAMMLRGCIDENPLSLEPYEAGWAAEAIAFLCVHDTGEVPSSLRVTLESSPDGIRWTPVETLTVAGTPGAHRLVFMGFGNWLRATLTSDQRCCADFYWVLK